MEKATIVENSEDSKNPEVDTGFVNLAFSSEDLSANGGVHKERAVETSYVDVEQGVESPALRLEPPDPGTRNSGAEEDATERSQHSSQDSQDPSIVKTDRGYDESTSVDTESFASSMTGESTTKAAGSLDEDKGPPGYAVQDLALGSLSGARGDFRGPPSYAVQSLELGIPPTARVDFRRPSTCMLVSLYKSKMVFFLVS